MVFRAGDALSVRVTAPIYPSKLFAPYFAESASIVNIMELFLCSDKTGFINRENICNDGDLIRQMIYHGDYGWKLED